MPAGVVSRLSALGRRLAGAPIGPRVEAAPVGAPRPISAPAGYGVSGLEAGSLGRRMASFRPASAHVNALISAAGRTVLDRARWLTRNNAYAINAVDWWGSAIVGPGITPSWAPHLDGLVEVEGRLIPLRQALREAWDAWTDEADAEGLTDLYGLQRRAVREAFIAGECFARLRDRRPEDGLSVPLQIQLLPSEMLDASDNRNLPNGNVVRAGIEFDAIGRRVAYHFWRNHPSDSTDGLFVAPGKSRVPAAEVVHLLDPVEGGQLRGLSRFANVTAKLFTLDGYDDAELERKKTAALFAGFVTRKGGADLTDPDGAAPFEAVSGNLPPEPGAPLVAGLEAGTMQYLEPGEGVEFSEPADVGGNYEAFQYRTLLAVAVGVGVPYFALTGDMTKGNYGNTRASSLDARRRTEAWQHSVMAFGFCRPVLARWLDAAALSGAVAGLDPLTLLRKAAAFRRVRWMMPPWGWVDPLKDAQRDVLLISNNIRARSEVVEEYGYDAAETDRRIAEDNERERRLGLTRGGVGAAVVPAEDSASDAPSNAPAATEAPA